MGYRVSAPLVYLRVPDVAGALVSYAFYQGATVPENTDKESLDHHLDSGMIVEDGNPLADVLAVPAGSPIPGEPPNVPVTTSTGAARSLTDRLEAVQKSVDDKQVAKAAEKKAEQVKPAPAKE